MPRWTIVAHLTVDADTPEAARTFAANELREGLAARGWASAGPDAAPRYTLAAITRVPTLEEVVGKPNPKTEPNA